MKYGLAFENPSQRKYRPMNQVIIARKPAGKLIIRNSPRLPLRIAEAIKPIMKRIRPRIIRQRFIRALSFKE